METENDIWEMSGIEPEKAETSDPDEIGVSGADGEDPDFIPPKPSSALHSRPAPKVVDLSESASSYIAGVKVTDTLAENKKRFSGWRDDPRAVEVVDGLSEGLTFGGADLSNVNFSGACLSFIDLRGADLRNADLSGVDLRGADLSGADLRGVNLEEANLDGANLEGALLDGAYLKNALIAGAKLSKKALNELERMQQLQAEAEEGKLDLRKVNLKYLDLRRLDLRGVDLTGVDLAGVNLVGVNLTGVKIDPMYLDGTYAFKQAAGRTLDIREGNLAGADLTTANMIRSQREDLEILKEQRRANQALEREAQAEMARLAEEAEILRKIEEREIYEAAQARIQARERAANRQNPATFQPIRPEAGAPAPVFASALQAGQAVPASAENEEKPVLTELDVLKERRRHQAGIEEMKERLQDVVLDGVSERDRIMKRPLARPRRKEELPASKYDFPVLYPVETEEKASKTASAVKEVSKVADRMTYHVKQAIRKIVPRRRRVAKQRQRG